MGWLERLGTYWVILVRPFGVSWRSGVRLLVGTLGVLGCVFLHCYFGMYLLRGISTLDAPALPRAPVRACTRLYAPVRACGRTCAYVRSCAPVRARVPAPLRARALPISAVASPRRALALGVPLLAPLGSLLGASLVRFS